MVSHFIKYRTIQTSYMALDGFNDLAKKMQTGKGIGRMRLDVDGDITKGLDMGLMGYDTDEEE